jgi:acyl dehydratase
MSTTTTTLAELRSFVGKELGTSDWIEVTQERVNLFADATGDHQWIHVDVERANRESPFGGPIAHGYLTLSLLIPMWKEVLIVTDMKVAVNYGLNKVRFPSPVPVGSKLRLGVEVMSVDVTGDGQCQATYRYTFEVEGASKPSCVAEVIVRMFE